MTHCFLEGYSHATTLWISSNCPTNIGAVSHIQHYRGGWGRLVVVPQLDIEVAPVARLVRLQAIGRI
jgi:hypothetical protein